MDNQNYSRKICISTNSTCNLNCIYCFEKNKKPFEFDENEALRIIKGFLKTKTKRGTKIKLLGGESFLVFPKIKIMCESLWEQDFPEYYHIHITTNGTLVHGEIQEWLYKHRDKITIKLSLDGNKKSSDINRPKSFNLVDIPFFLRTWPDIYVNMTITPETIPYFYDNIIYLHSIGIKNIVSHLSLMTDWSKRGMEKDFFRQLLSLADFYLKNQEIKPCYFFSHDIGLTLIKEHCTYPCTNEQKRAYDFQTKKFYKCHMCFPSLGGEKVSEQLSRIDFSKINDADKDPCVKCKFFNLCITCYAENYITRGAIFKRDMSMCLYNKLTFAALCKYEYARILRLAKPNDNDIRKMMAIYALQDEINAIENQVK